MHPIYLDYHATTPIDPRVLAVLVRHLTNTFGNAHSRDHTFGDVAESMVEVSRREISALVDATPDDVTFTAGATEAINLALIGLALEYRASGRLLRVAASAAEHAAVLDTARWLAECGLATMAVLPVDGLAHVRLEALQDACRRGLDVACLMAANNEVGTISDLSTIAKVVRAHDVLWLCDATQAVGKIPLRMAPNGPDLLALSGHKFYGPKGVGALIVRRGVRLRPIIHGGGHERGLRSGSLNVPSIAALGEAARLRRSEMSVDETEAARRRDSLQEALQNSDFTTVVNGDPANRLSGNLHISFPGLPNQAIIARLRDRIAISTGSACSSGIEAPSHVLRAMSLSRSTADSALRFGLGKFVSDDDVTAAAELVLLAAREVADRL